MCGFPYWAGSLGLIPGSRGLHSLHPVGWWSPVLQGAFPAVHQHVSVVDLLLLTVCEDGRGAFLVLLADVFREFLSVVAVLEQMFKRSRSWSRRFRW